MKNIKIIYQNNRENLRTIEKIIMSDKVFAWGILFVVIIMTSIISTEDVKVIEKVHSYQNEVKKPVETKKTLSVNERAFKLITKYEGFHDKPYWDYKQWSCGYGMRCSKNTKNITREKSKKFVMERINHIRKRHDLYNIDDSIEVALISFTYNLGTPPEGYRWYLAHGYTNGLKNRFKEYSYAGGKFMRGLYKRRVDESSFLN